MTYKLNQSGSKQEFSTGAQRDSAEGKPRLDLISPLFLDRLGTLLAKGADHYGERNWEKGMPLSRLLSSACRHLNQLLDGQEDEDHAIQCAFNLMAYVHTLHRIRSGSLPAELDDLPREKNLNNVLTSDKNEHTIGRGWKVEKTFTCTDNSEPLIRLRFKCRCTYTLMPVEELDWREGKRTRCPRCDSRLSYGRYTNVEEC